MKKTLFVLIFLGLSILAISACAPTPCSPVLQYGPVLDSPPHDSIVSDLRPVLTWIDEEECPPDEFIINMAQNGTNGTITTLPFGGATGSYVTSWSPSVDLEVGVAYLWDVTAKNATKTSYPSDQWQFIVGDACDSLSLVAPTNELPVDGGTVTTADPTYTWGYADPTCTPAGYHIQVSSTADFSVLEVDVTDDDNPFKAWTTGILLSDCTDYYLRVAAVDGVDEGPWSTVSEFSTDLAGVCLCDPGSILAPFITAPGVFEVVPDLFPSIQWTDPSTCGVEGYAIHLSPDSDFTDTTYNGGTGTPSTLWVPGMALQEVTRYFAKVAGMVGIDMGPWSSTRSFFTGPECTSPSELVAPELFSPAHNEVVTDGFARLEFGPGTSPCQPDGYFINLETGVSGNLMGSFGTPSGTILTDPLDDCKIYTWEVAAHQNGTNGPFSETRRFYTNESGTCVFLTLVRPYLDMACLFGPDPLFEIVGYILEEEETEVFAMSLDGKWLAVQNPDDAEGFHCWGLTEKLKFLGEIPTNIPRWKSPPLPVLEPTPTPEGCWEGLSEQACIANGGKPRTDGTCACP
jgi:hypothetical protein